MRPVRSFFFRRTRLLAAVALLAPCASADDVTYVGGNGLWNTASNWSVSYMGQSFAARLPDQNDTVLIPANVAYNVGANSPGYGILRVDAAATPTLTLNQAVTVNAGVFRVGYAQRGAVTHSAGTVNALTPHGLVIGSQAGAVGSYALSGSAALNVESQLIVGEVGAGSFNQSGTSTVNAADATVVVGSESPGVGTYTKSGGSLTAYDLQIAPYGGAGTFNHSAGQLTVANELSIGANGRFNHTGGTVKTAALTIAAGGKLDLTNRALVIDYAGGSPLATIANLVKTGATAGRTWTGAGITSGTAAADAAKRTGIGFVESATSFPSLTGGQTASWNDVAVDSTSLLVRHTLYGDADLDGAVGLNDLVRLSNAYGTANATWATGDFDYDGAVGLNDLVLMSNNYGTALPGLDTPAGSPDFAADWAYAQALPTATPEPGALALLASATALLTRRRRRLA